MSLNSNIFCVMLGLVAAGIVFMFALVLYSNITESCVDNCEEFSINSWYVVGVIPPIAFFVVYFIAMHFENKREFRELSRYR